MDLETFIEEDIQEFLEEQKEQQEASEEEAGAGGAMPVHKLTEDYAQKIRNALEQNKVREARHVYSQLRDEYQSFPENSRARSTAYSVLQEAKSIFEEHGHGDTVDLPDAPPSSYKERRENKIERLKAEKKRKDQCVEQIRKDIERVEQLVDKSDPVAAVHVYQNAKNLFRQIPIRYEDVREELYDELITCYKMIQRRTSQKPKNIVEDNQPTADLLSHLEDVRQLVRKKELDRARDEYEQLVDDVKEYDGPRKKEFMQDIEALRDSIQQAVDERQEREQRSPPDSTIPEDDETEDDEEPDETIKRGIRSAYNYLDNDNVESARKRYRELQALYNQLDDDARERLRRDLIDLYEDIQDAQRSSFEASPPEDYHDAVQEIESLIQDGDIAAAEEKYLDVQEQLMDAPEKVRRKLYDTLEALKSRLTSAKSDQRARV